MSEILVCETPTDDGPRFDQENIARIYRGEPALVDGMEVSEVLTPRVFEAASYAAQGLTYQKIADKTGCMHGTAKEKVSIAYGHLGVLFKYGLAPYFPVDQDDSILEGKGLGDLKDRLYALEILEALSTGGYYREIAEERGISPSTARDHIKDISNAWPNVSGTPQVLRIANGLRGRYVRAIESASGPMAPEDMSHLAFPRLARLESAILRRHST